MTGPRPVVLDASVAIALLTDEPEGTLAGTALERWTTEMRKLAVPAHFWLEVVNRLAREPRASGADILKGIHRLDSLELETVEIDRPLLVQAIDRMERTGLTAYDAVYLVVAESLDAGLATFDSALAAAAGDRLEPIDGQHRTSERAALYEHDVTWPRYKEASAYLAQLRAEALAGRG